MPDPELPGLEGANASGVRALRQTRQADSSLWPRSAGTAEAWVLCGGQHGARGQLSSGSKQAEAGRGKDQTSTTESKTVWTWGTWGGQERQLSSIPRSRAWGPWQRSCDTARRLPLEGPGRRHLTPGGGKRAACIWACVGGCKEGRREEAGFLEPPQPQRQTDRQTSGKRQPRGHSSFGKCWVGRRQVLWPWGGGNSGETGRVSEEVRWGATVPG